MSILVNPKRVRLLKEGGVGNGPVVYWMQRDQRFKDNWALLAAWRKADTLKRPLVVVFCLVSKFLEATIRHFGFMLSGLEETADDLAKNKISLRVLQGEPAEEIPAFLMTVDAACLFTDFSPLRICRTWKAGVAKRAKVLFYEVDAHNVVPAWVASTKLEIGARTLRPKIHRLLPEFLEEFPNRLPSLEPYKKTLTAINWDLLRASLSVRRDIGELPEWVPGPRAGMNRLKKFVSGPLEHYATGRNDPNQDAQSDLSPYFHFGHLAPQRAALEAARAEVSEEARAAFLEELIVRRELADNFCLNEPEYDSVNAFPNWAQDTLGSHQSDPRLKSYSLEKLESADTHDLLWNAAQRQMVVHGKMHGYLRMYWAKKILEWTSEPAEALAWANLLNDRYELDGRDPNGYAGTAWSIGGVHDRAWPQRPVFGKVRYMNLKGCRRKFDVDAVIDRWKK